MKTCKYFYPWIHKPLVDQHGGFHFYYFTTLGCPTYQRGVFINPGSRLSGMTKVAGIIQESDSTL